METEAAVTQLAVPWTCVCALRDIQRRAFVFVTHTFFHVLRTHFVLRDDPQRHVFAFIFAVCFTEGLTRSIVEIAVHVTAEMTEERPYARLAYIKTAEVERIERSLEREVLICAGKIAFLTRKSNDIFVPHPVTVADAVQFLLQPFLLFRYLRTDFHFAPYRQGGDTCLICVCRDGVVRNPNSHPVGSFLTGPFADEVHDPNLVRVAERERFAFGGVAVFVDERNEPLDGFAGCFRTLQRDINETSVIDTDGVPQCLTSAPCGLTDSYLVLVHVTHHRIGVRHLRNGTLRTTGIPVFHFAHRTFRIVSSRREMQETVHSVRVSGIGNHRRAIHRGIFADEEVGAGKDQ